MKAALALPESDNHAVNDLPFLNRKRETKRLTFIGKDFLQAEMKRHNNAAG
jgi:hypothetical protein